MRAVRVLLLAVAASTLLHGRALSEQQRPAQATPQDVSTPDVHLLAARIQEELEVLRWHMGRPAETRDPIPVAGAAIRENFLQAMTLWSKVNELGVELVGGGEAPPVVPLGRDEDYGPSHVHLVLTSVLERLEEIEEGVGVVGAAGMVSSASVVERDPTATPSDVYRVIVQSGRQVNRMLEREAQPGDVYQRVQQAVFYAAEILVAIDDPTPLPVGPAYEAGLMPGHVYGRLLSAFDRLSVAFDTLGLRMLRWSGGAYQVDESLTPGDVYDLATLLLSEFEYLHARVPGARAPLQSAHPGRRWPSDVYQQAGVLLEQTARIMVHAQRNPNMLEGGGRQWASPNGLDHHRRARP